MTMKFHGIDDVLRLAGGSTGDRVYITLRFSIALFAAAIGLGLLKLRGWAYRCANGYQICTLIQIVILNVTAMINRFVAGSVAGGLAHLFLLAIGAILPCTLIGILVDQRDRFAPARQ